MNHGRPAVTRLGHTKRSRTTKKSGKSAVTTKEDDYCDGSEKDASDDDSEEEETNNTNVPENVGSPTALASTSSLRLPSVSAGGLVDGLETILFHLRRQRESSTDALFRASLLPAEQLLAPALFGVQAACDYLRSLDDAGLATLAVGIQDGA